MVTSLENKMLNEPGKDLLVLDQRFFIDQGPATNAGSSIEGGTYSIRLDRDSYVWLFSRRRGRQQVGRHDFLCSLGGYPL